MASPRDTRIKTAIVLVTLASSAFFVAQGATALIGAKVLSGEPSAKPAPSRRSVASARFRQRHDPDVILRRNIFDSALGDLTAQPIPEADVPLEDLAPGEIATACDGRVSFLLAERPAVETIAALHDVTIQYDEAKP